MPKRWLVYMVVTVALAATLSGCISLDVSERVATREEPAAAKTFLLTADDSAYTVSRWWPDDYETVTVKRQDLPADCPTPRFFLNDPEHELRLSAPATSPWVTGTTPPCPDDSYPPCALLVSYGHFSGPPELEGVAITTRSGLLAKGERIRPHPAVWALTPVAMVAEGYAMVGATLTLPLWGPYAYFSGENEEARVKDERSRLPAPVTACWVAIEEKAYSGWSYVENIPVSGFTWSSAKEGAYTLEAGAAPGGSDRAAVDARVTLHRGRA